MIILRTLLWVLLNKIAEIVRKINYLTIKRKIKTIIIPASVKIYCIGRYYKFLFK